MLITVKYSIFLKENRGDCDNKSHYPKYKFSTLIVKLGVSTFTIMSSFRYTNTCIYPIIWATNTIKRTKGSQW